MTSVVESNGVSNDVLEVDSARGTLKSPRAAALNDGMLAASAKLYPGQHVRIPLRFESVRRPEDSHRSAIKGVDEDLFAGFQVHTAWSVPNPSQVECHRSYVLARHPRPRQQASSLLTLG
jgi:hypothetical protein